MDRGSKAFIIGLDGASFDITDPLIQRGMLPNIQRLIQGGVSCRLRSTLPPITAPAWVSFLTGKNPGKHGVFDFRTFDLSKYSCYNESPVNSSYYAGDTILDIFSSQGLKVAAVGIPMTYPPFKINGVMVSGFPQPKRNEFATYPKSLSSKIGRLDIPFTISHESPEQSIEIMEQEMDKYLSVSLNLLKGDDYDLFIVVFCNTDWAVHLFWHHRDTSVPGYNPRIAGKYKNAIDRQYEKCDDAIGQLLECMDDNTTLFLMSDHGVGRAPLKFFNTNLWLDHMGLLSRKRPIQVQFHTILQRLIHKLIVWLKRAASGDPLRMKAANILKSRLLTKMKEQVTSKRLNVGCVDWRNTKAYRVPMFYFVEGIEINLKGRQPQGVVSPGDEYEATRDEIIDNLGEVRDNETDEKIVEGIYRKEELYTGQFMDNAPDIVVVLSPGYRGGCGFKTVFEPVRDFPMGYGTHRMDGIFIAYGKNVQEGRRISDAEIIDLAPTVLYAGGLPIPNTMDGRVLWDIFMDQCPKPNTMAIDKTMEDKSVLSVDEEDQILSRLQALGYL